MALVTDRRASQRIQVLATEGVVEWFSKRVFKFAGKGSILVDVI
jgi:hypothetical protein